MFSNETVCSKYCSFEKCFSSSYLEKAMKNAMRWKAIYNEIMQ